MTASQQRFAFLDTLRFLGAAIVVLFHIYETRVTNDVIKHLLESGIGTGAVVMFFIISGYVMPFAVRKGLDLREFFIRRACRLFPLYFAALAVIALGGATGLIEHWSYMWQSSPFVWFANLLIIQDFVGARPFLGVSWTLAIEMIWYVLFFVALAALGKRAGPVMDVLAIAGMIALALLSLAIDTRIPLGRPAMIYACVVGYQIYRYSAGELSKRGMLLSVAMFIAVTSFTNYVAFGIYAHHHVVLGAVLISWIGAPLVFVAVILMPRLRESPVLNRGFLPYLGIMSYSIYLLHPIAIAIATQYVVRGWQPAAALALTGVFTLAGYYLVELPGIDLGRRLARNLGRAPGKLTPA